MKPNLKRGQLLTPASVVEGVKRLQQLKYEMQKIEEQLADLTRIVRYPVMAEYDEWHHKASFMLRQFKVEENKLRQWLDKEVNGQVLFKRAYELLLKLELDVDFEPDEAALMEELDYHFECRRSAPKERQPNFQQGENHEHEKA